MSQSRIVVAYSDSDASEAERSLAQSLKLELCSRTDINALTSDYFLYFDAGGLALQALTSEPAPGPLRVDLSKLERRATDGLFKQNLLKACGVGKGKRPTVLDATAGLGTDSYLLAAAGCQVLALEENPIIFALLTDAVARYQQSGDAEAELISRLEIRKENFLASNKNPNSFQVVYLDPMFPTKSNSAQAKKNMVYLQALLGNKAADQELFSTARAIAKERVVVKRAKNSPLLTEAESDISFKGSSSRFDVYLAS